MKKLKISIPLLLMLVLLINTTTLLSPVAAQYAILAVWSPDYSSWEIIDTNLGPGSSFDIWIIVEYVEDLYGYEFKLRYNPAVLNATALTNGGFFSDFKVWAEEIYRDVGYVWYAISMPEGSPAGISGSGILAVISFTVLSYGGSLLDLDDTILGNSPPSGGINMDHEVIDGVFSNVGIPPVASFIASQYEVVGDEYIYFDASASYDPDGYIVSYHWDWGDGTSDTTTTPVIAHNYEKEFPGVFTVGLIVTDNGGAQDYAECTITVYAPITLKAELTEWKAKPAHKRLDTSKHGYVNTFFATVANLANITDPVTVKVSFTVVYPGGVRTVETNEYTFGPNTYLATTDDLAIQYGWHGLNTTTQATGLPDEFDVTGLELGRFFVTARASYKIAGGDYTPGTVTKTFSFRVTP